MMKRTLFSLIALAVISLSSCTDATTTGLDDVGTFSRQLIGVWELQTADITPVHTSKSVDIAPSRSFACNQLSTAFQAKDVVSRFCINFNNDQVKVDKFYTCSLAPEQLSWRIELENSTDTNRNWMSGKNFVIKEINEGEVQAIYKLSFFNLENTSPDGSVSTKDTQNQLWLEVKYDKKEASQSFKMKLRKVE